MSQSTTDGLTRAEYRDEIETMADQIETFIEANPETADEVPDFVFEEVDSSQLVIYNSYHLGVLEHAENDPDDWRSFVPNDADWRKVLQIMAFRCMEQDLYEELRERGLY